jgi:hypothetical protein
MYIGLPVEDFYQILMKPEFLRQTFGKYSNMKFHENLSGGSRVLPGGQTDRQQIDMTNLIVASRSFSNAHTNHCFMWHWNDGVVPRVCNYFDHVLISNLGTHLNIARVNKRNFVTGSLPDSNINSYALDISFRPSACFNRRNAGGNIYKIPCENFTKRKVEPFHSYFPCNTLYKKLPQRLTHA